MTDNVLDWELKKWPRPPRKLCTKFSNWVNGIISPSLAFEYRWQGDKETIQYFIDNRRHMLYKRTLSKAGYKQLYRDFKNREEKEKCLK